MPEHPTVEKRLDLLENRVAGLERARHVQEDRDIALLARVDNLIDDVHRVERSELHHSEFFEAGVQYIKDRCEFIERDVDELKGDVHELKEDVANLTESTLAHAQVMETLATQVMVLTKGQQTLEAGQQALEEGQQQILKFLQDRFGDPGDQGNTRKTHD